MPVYFFLSFSPLIFPINSRNLPMSLFHKKTSVNQLVAKEIVSPVPRRSQLSFFRVSPSAVTGRNTAYVTPIKRSTKGAFNYVERKKRKERKTGIHYSRLSGKQALFLSNPSRLCIRRRRSSFQAPWRAERRVQSTVKPLFPVRRPPWRPIDPRLARFTDVSQRNTKLLFRSRSPFSIHTCKRKK